MTDITKILADLYALDPALKKHEAELATLIQQLLLAKPDTKFDEGFARRLHSQLESAQKNQPSMIQNYTVSMKKMMYTLFGSAAVVAAALLITIFSGKVAVPTNRLLSLSSADKRAQTVSTRRLAANAFGSLTGSSAVGEKGASATAPMAPLLNSQAADTAPAPATAKMMAPAFGGGDVATGVANSAMIMRPYYPYTFVYKGGDIALPDKNVDVHRRVKPSDGRSDLASALSGVSIGGFTVGSFAGSSLMSFELKQPGADGYTISVQLGEGTASISRSTPFTIMPVPVPMMENAKPSADNELLPADSELVAIATQFLNSHGVDMSQYGAAIVQNDWQNVMPVDTISARPQTAPAQKVSALRVYFPQSITVLFPRKLNGTIVYDQGGSQTGITVNVNTQNKVVESVWGIQTTDYESSAYQAVTDVKKILEIAERGGVYGSGYPADAEARAIELGSPERVYMVYYKYNNTSNEELLVPALRFPVTKVPDGVYYYQKSIVVPLVAELLDQNQNPGPIMYMNGAAGASGSSGSATVVVPPVAPQVAPVPSK